MKQATPKRARAPLPAPAAANPRDDRARARILAYAGRLFAERGFRKISIDELCAGMAMSKRTFYKHFSGRDALVEAVLFDTIGAIAPEMIANLDSNRPVRDIFDRHFDILLNRLLPSLAMPFLADVQALLPETWARIEAFRAGIVVKVVGLLRRGQAEGAIRDDVNPEVVGNIISALMASVANPAFALARGLSLPETGRALHAILYRGMLPLESKKRFTTESQRHREEKKLKIKN